MKKYCSKCANNLDVSLFSKNKSKKDGLQEWCKKCKSAKYRERREHNCNRVYKRKKILSEWFKDYKLKLSCNSCDEKHPACLQFHHRDPQKKEAVISEAIWNGWSLNRIKEEIAKCDVLCANCHAKKHHKP